MTDPTETPWDKRLGCEVVSLTYDFCSGTGELFLPDRNCCDMTGCVKMFESIDPQVSTIKTYSGDKPDTAYRKEGAEWKALRPS